MEEDSFFCFWACLLGAMIFDHMNPADGADWKSQLLQVYVDRHAVGNFERGGTTDIYIDGRMVTTHPRSLQIIADRMCQIIEEDDLLTSDTNIVAPVLGGVPIAVALGLRLNRPIVLDRGAPKTHGRGRRFEGAVSEAQQCLVVDDLIWKGKTLKDSVVALRECKMIVEDAIVTVDRQEGGVELLGSIGVTVRSLITQEELRLAWGRSLDR